MGNSALHIAAKHGHFLIVKYLLENGANVRIANRQGLTAYDFAQTSKSDLEKQRAEGKRKIGGPGFNEKQLQIKLEDYTKILTFIKK